MTVGGTVGEPMGGSVSLSVLYQSVGRSVQQTVIQPLLQSLDTFPIKQSISLTFHWHTCDENFSMTGQPYFLHKQMLNKR